MGFWGVLSWPALIFLCFRSIRSEGSNSWLWISFPNHRSWFMFKIRVVYPLAQFVIVFQIDLMVLAFFIFLLHWIRFAVIDWSFRHALPIGHKIYLLSLFQLTLKKIMQVILILLHKSPWFWELFTKSIFFIFQS